MEISGTICLTSIRTNSVPQPVGCENRNSTAEVAVYPEIFGVRKDTSEYKREMKAKEYVENRFKENNNECIIRSHHTGKYGRWIAEIWPLNSKKSLSQELLDERLADEYE